MMIKVMPFRATDLTISAFEAGKIIIFYQIKSNILRHVAVQIRHN